MGLSVLGHEVHVVTAGERSRVISRDGVYVHEVCGADQNRYSTFAAMGYQNLRHWLNHSHSVFEKVKTLQLNHEIQIVDSPLWNLDGLVTAVSQKIPVVVRVVTAMKQIAAIHGREDDETSIIAELEGEFLRMASAIVSNSRGSVRMLREIYGINPEDRLHHIASYGIIPVGDDEVPEHEVDSTKEPTVLFVGRLEGRKGILELFGAIPEVLRKAPKTRFQIAGSDNSVEDGFQATHGMDYPSYFRKKFSSCAGQTEFLGFVDENRLQSLYRECDVFVAPSHYESFGLIYLEAMNYARPVIGCRSGGPEDIIVDGETGFLVPPQDPSAIANAIVELVTSPQRRGEMGRAGRKRLIERFSHITMAREFVDVYQRLLGDAKTDLPDGADKS
jgi:glycosyltransferase involved in cell wall biosynthesis